MIDVRSDAFVSETTCAPGLPARPLSWSIPGCAPSPGDIPQVQMGLSRRYRGKATSSIGPIMLAERGPVTADAAIPARVFVECGGGAFTKWRSTSAYGRAPCPDTPLAARCRHRTASSVPPKSGMPTPSASGRHIDRGSRNVDQDHLAVRRESAILPATPFPNTLQPTVKPNHRRKLIDFPA
jgi:hypothetical protein